jgi:hypothetical protein
MQLDSLIFIKTRVKLIQKRKPIKKMGYQIYKLKSLILRNNII